MNEEMNTIENETTEDNTVTTVEEDERQELMEAVNELAEDEENSETDSEMNLKSALKIGVGFAAGYVVGSTVQKVKIGKDHPEILEKKPKEHFWNRLHFQSPIKLDKKDKPVEESKDDSKETKNPENTQTPGTDQEKK